MNFPLFNISCYPIGCIQLHCYFESLSNLVLFLLKLCFEGGMGEEYVNVLPCLSLPNMSNEYISTSKYAVVLTYQGSRPGGRGIALALSGENSVWSAFSKDLNHHIRT